MNSKLVHQTFIIVLSFVGLIFSLRVGLVNGEINFSGNLRPQLIYICIGALTLLLTSRFSLNKLFSWQVIPTLLIILLPFLFIDTSDSFSVVVSIITDCMRYLFICWFIYLLVNDNIQEKIKYISLIGGSYLYWLSLLISKRHSEILFLLIFLLVVMLIFSFKNFSKFFKVAFYSLVIVLFFSFTFNLFSQYIDSGTVYKKDIAQVVFSNFWGKGVGDYLLTDGLLTNSQLSYSTILVAVDMFGWFSFFGILLFPMIFFGAMIFNLWKKKNIEAIIAFLIAFFLALQFVLHYIINLSNILHLEVSLPIFSGGSKEIIGIMFGLGILFKLVYPTNNNTTNSQLG